MSTPTPERILRAHALRHTEARARVLEALAKAGAALSQPELEQQLEGVCDRVTIYRTLDTLLAKGVLHRVPDGAGLGRFALCPPTCTGRAEHEHDHAHFKCDQCGHTRCVDSVAAPAPQLPQGYQLRAVQILLSGTCPHCAKP